MEELNRDERNKQDDTDLELTVDSASVGSPPVERPKPRSASAANKMITTGDVFFILLTMLYLYDWAFKDLTVSRAIAVIVLSVGWTLFIVKLARR